MQPAGLLKISTSPGLPGVEVWSVHEAIPRIQAVTLGFEFAGPDRADRVKQLGTGRFQRQRRELGGLDLVLLRPGEVWDCTLHGPVSSYHRVVLDVDKVGAYVPEDSPGGRRQLARWAVSNPLLVETFERLCVAFDTPGTEEIVREHYLVSFLVGAFELGDDLPPIRQARGCERAIRHVRELIEDRYYDTISLATLAQETSLSVYHLERTFTERIGVPIHRYLQLVRVRRCIELLRSGRRPVDVWMHCGFADQAHMSRTFRKTIGLTPGQIGARL